MFPGRTGGLLAWILLISASYGGDEKSDASFPVLADALEAIDNIYSENDLALGLQEAAAFKDGNMGDRDTQTPGKGNKMGPVGWRCAEGAAMGWRLHRDTSGDGIAGISWCSRPSRVQPARCFPTRNITAPDVGESSS